MFMYNPVLLTVCPGQKLSGNRLPVISFLKQSMNIEALLCLRVSGIHNPISASLKSFLIPISSMAKQTQSSHQRLVGTNSRRLTV